MQHSDGPRIELEKARAAIAPIESLDTIAAREEQWKEFLRRLDRAWNKALAHYKRSGKWGSWHGHFVQMRTSDPLLSYLVQARNADEHTLEPVTGRQVRMSGDVRIDPNDENAVQFGDMGFIKGVRFIGPGRTVHVLPQRLVLPPVVNRGKRYEPPSMHLGKAIDGTDPWTVAQLGLSFYDEFLTAAEVRFVK